MFEENTSQKAKIKEKMYFSTKASQNTPNALKISVSAEVARRQCQLPPPNFKVYSVYQRIAATLEGKPMDSLAYMPITMMFAACALANVSFNQDNGKYVFLKWNG